MTTLLFDDWESLTPEERRQNLQQNANNLVPNPLLQPNNSLLTQPAPISVQDYLTTKGNVVAGTQYENLNSNFLNQQITTIPLGEFQARRIAEQNQIFTNFPGAQQYTLPGGGVVWIDPTAPGAADVIAGILAGTIGGGFGTEVGGLPGVLLHAMPEITAYTIPQQYQIANATVQRPTGLIDRKLTELEQEIQDGKSPAQIRNDIIKNLTGEEIKAIHAELDTPMEERAPLMVPLSAPPPGRQSIQLAIRVFQEDTQPSQKEIPLQITVAPYDPVLVPLRQAMIEVLQAKMREIVKTYSDPERYLKTLLNFGDDIQRILINWKLDPNDTTKLLVKLLEPLDNNFEIGQNVLISREVANTIVDTVKFEIAPLQDTSLWLRPLNNDVRLLNQTGNILRNKTLQSIGINTEGVEDEYGNYSFANEILRRWYTDDYRSVELNIDYTDYKNFVRYSSAELRLQAFRQKLSRLYELEQNSRYLGGIATGSIFGTNAFMITVPVVISSSTATYPSPTSIIPPSGSLSIATGSTVTVYAPDQIPSASVYLREGSKKAALEIEQIIRGFDPYERYLFYGSGSAYSASVYWTDDNTEYHQGGNWPKRDNGTLYLPTELEAVQWYTTQSAIAQRYDEFNYEILNNSIPTYLQADTQSEDFVKFTKLIGHFFDNIRLYIENMDTMYDRKVKATEGLSQDLVWDIAKSFGINLVNPYAMDSLYNYITDTTSLTKKRELTTELFKRFLHNSLYLNRMKGTRTSLHALLNIFGLNEQIINIKESDTPTTASFDIFDEVTNVLNFNSGSYIKIPLSSSLRETHTIQFRFASTNKQITTLATGDQLWHMRLNTHPTASSRLGRIEVTNDIGEILLTSSYSDMFSGDYFDVMLRYNSASVNLQAAKSDGEEILYTSSMYTTASYIRDALPLTGYMYLGGSGSLSLNNFDGTVDEVRIWGEQTEDDNFLDQALNPGSFAGNAYWSAAENLYVRLSFHKPTDLASGRITNDTPYKNVDGVSDPTKPLLPNITYLDTYGFTASPGFPHQMSRINRKVYQYTTNAGASAYGSNKIIVQPPPVFLETTPLGEPILSRTKSIVSIEARKQQPQSKKFVGFFVSPTDAVNNLIIRSLGNVDIANKVGYPGNRYKNKYIELEAFKEYYNRFYAVPVNIGQFVRFFDKIIPILFEQSKALMPAKTTLSSGIVIEPNILERKKVSIDRPTKLSGANTRRNKNAVSTSRTYNRDMDITVSTDTRIDIKNTSKIASSSYVDIFALFQPSELFTIPEVDISNLTTTVQRTTASFDSEYKTYNAAAINTSRSIYADDVLDNLVTGGNINLNASETLGQYYTYTGNTINVNDNKIISSSYVTYEEIIDIGDIISEQNKNLAKATIIEEIPPIADFRDYGVINYFNKTSGIYYFERVRKQTVGQKQYNFLTGSQATWSFGTIYNKNDVVVQAGATGDAKYGNNKLYRFVAQNSPVESYNYPSIDKNNWVPIFYTGKAVQSPYRVIFDIYRTNTIEDLTVLPLTIVDISRPINEPKRYNTRLRLQSLAAHIRVTGAIRLQIIATLFAIRSSVSNIRIRLYDSTLNRTADLNRPVGIEPVGDHGVLLDFTVTPDIKNVNYPFFPEIRLANNDSSPNALIYYTIDEVGGSDNNNVNIDFNYFAIETETIVPKGYLQRHYKFFRDNLLSTKRRNYIGCLQTQDTTTDGRPPVEVNLTAGTSITVSPNILLDEENLGGTNLNV